MRVRPLSLIKTPAFRVLDGATVDIAFELSPGVI
jgi:hypothetical protein